MNLANELRPESLDDIIGQQHILPLLKKMKEKNEIFSLILYGKPGIGKTSLAHAFLNDLKKDYTYFNATTGNKKELQELIKINDALIIDEIHRLNKDKQDILLPAIEFGKIFVIATTTENPFFVVNPAVRSRMHILELKEVDEQDIQVALRKIIIKQNMDVKISDELLNKIAKQSNGDFRYAINILSILNKLYSNSEIDEKVLKSVIPSIHFFSDKNGDGHYDLLSAFHKSLRGSDVDASLYYLGRLIETGDIIGMERRMLAATYEDVGLANPNLPLRVISAIDTAKRLGFPEARLPLSVAVIDIAQSNKSNSAYLAINNVIDVINGGGVYDIPKHLKDSHYSSANKLGNGIGYKYVHDYADGKVEQQYLPDKIKDTIFYKKNKNDKI